MERSPRRKTIEGWITSETARAHVQTLRHRSDAILTGIGTVLADDCLLDRPHRRGAQPAAAAHRARFAAAPAAGIADGGVLPRTTCWWSPLRRHRPSGASVWKRRACASRCSKARTAARICDAVVELLAREKYLSLMIEAGSSVNWTALESGVADKIFFYYAPKILGGMQSLAGGRRRGTPPPRGCDPVSRCEAASDHGQRIRGGGVAGKRAI